MLELRLLMVDEFNEEHKHQNIRVRYLMLNKHFLVRIRCRFNAHFSWDTDNIKFEFQGYVHELPGCFNRFECLARTSPCHYFK